MFRMFFGFQCLGFRIDVTGEAVCKADAVVLFEVLLGDVL
jgi:hypothetical protein